jgi:hypothetical protein
MGCPPLRDSKDKNMEDLINELVEDESFTGFCESCGKPLTESTDNEGLCPDCVGGS